MVLTSRNWGIWQKSIREGIRAGRYPEQTAVDSAARSSGLGRFWPLVPHHAEVIAEFGGSDGVREMALLESAVAAPQASFGGQSPYRDVAEMAAAYLFYLCRNSPFLDGNKRAALGACIVFLRLNGIEPKADGPEWEELTLAVAASAIDRDETTMRLRKRLPRQK